MRPGEIRHQRIVRVDDEKRLFGKASDHRPPALGDQLQLPVAVELVAEEVAETHDARPDGGGQVGQRRLVDLEQAQLGIACVDEGRRDARGEVRTGGVVGQPEAGSRIADVIAALVVLPFVADRITLPSGRRFASLAIAPGSIAVSSFPGSVVPPPCPARRDR